MSPKLLVETYDAIGDAVSWYIHTLVLTLTNPRPAFPPIAVSAEGRVFPESAQEFRLNRGVFSFAIASVVLGTILKSVPGSFPDNAGMVGATVVVLIFWLLFSAAAHALARLAGGGASFLQSITVTVQVFGTVYLVANFLALLWFMITGSWAVAGIGRIVSSPALSLPVRSFFETARAYFLIQGILLAIYFPFAIHNTHRLSWLRTIIVFGILFTVCIVLMNVSLHASTGGRIRFKK
jgi:hypothetical protein